jgi:phenylacetate-coenzyme A ligase PaaK-like adenylate-forming protein
MSESLQGVTFICGSEPFTEAKREAILRIGATATPHYGFVTGGSVGYGCGRPIHADEIHVNRHTMALIAAPEGHPARGASVRPFLFTTLLASDPSLLLNVENGDYGILAERHCGCAMERAGLTLHLHGIRSYEKFTSEGMNYFYGDLFDIFEKRLPAEFGGGPGDYQLAEEEDGDGRTRLTLRVDPKIADLDEAKVIARLKEHLADGSWQNQFQVRVWDDAGTFRIRRETPHADPRGKILPLQFSRSSRP